uniref:MBD domain-containing protein n=1 Tax=Timema monikensis TaxID=170555 RepID=A0A7R9E5T3_9NEOP|nr:unnamed protein product [Timema monikensis]
MEVQTPEYVSSNGRKRRRASARSTSSSADDSNHSTRLIIKDSNKEIALPNGEPNDTSTGSESKDFTNKLGGGTIPSPPANVNSNVNNLNSKIVSDDEASANGDQMEIEELSVHKQPHRAESVIQIDSDDADSDSSNESFHGFSSDPSAHIFNVTGKFLGRADLKRTKSNSDDLDVVATIRMMGPDDYYVVTDDSESKPGPSGLSKTSQLANKSITSPVVVKEEPVDKDDNRSPAPSPNSRLQVKSNAALGIQSDSWNKRKSTDGTAKRKISLNVSDNKLDSTPVAEDGVSLTSSAASTPSQSSFKSESRSSKGKLRPTIDTLDPIFKKPLEMGWRRELVYRNAIDSSNRRNCDVYYYTPQGRKVRSSKEVLDHIDGVKLTLKNFTFAKDTLGTNDPEKEIVRDARRVSGREPSSTPPKKIPKAKPKPVQAKLKMNFDIKTEPDSPTPASPTVSSLSPLSPNMSPTVLLKRAVIPPGTTTTKSSLFTNYPKIKLSRYVKPVKKKPVTSTPTPSVVAKPLVSNIKIKRNQRSRSSDDDNRENSDDMEMGMLPPTWEVDSAGKKGSGTNKNSWGSAKLTKPFMAYTQVALLPFIDTQLGANLSGPVPSLSVLALTGLLLGFRPRGTPFGGVCGKQTTSETKKEMGEEYNKAASERRRMKVIKFITNCVLFVLPVLSCFLSISSPSLLYLAHAHGCRGGNKLSEPCSIRCLGVMGLIPSLQCRLCLCLYHPECVGLGTITETIHSYVCKNCQQEIKEGKTSLVTVSKLFSPAVAKSMNTSKLTSPKLSSATKPPALTPINIFGMTKSANLKAGQNVLRLPTVPTLRPTTSPPKMLSHPGEPQKLQTISRLVKVSAKNRDSLLLPKIPLTVAAAKTNTVRDKTIVGSVTTWLPPSSTIQLNSSSAKSTVLIPPTTSIVTSSSTPNATTVVSPESSAASRALSVVWIDGSKYVVTPKHNVMSVSPSPALTATTPSLRSTTGDTTPSGDKPPVGLTIPSTTLIAASQGSSVQTSTQSMLGQSQVLLATSASGGQSMNIVQTTSASFTQQQLTSFVSGASGTPILPKPSPTSTYIVSSPGTAGIQNPAGVLLVPLITTGDSKGTPQHPQYLILNSPTGGLQGGSFIVSSLPSATSQSLVQDASAEEGDMSDEKAGDGSRKRKAGKQQGEGPMTKMARVNSGPTMPRLFVNAQHISSGYGALLHLFQYLKVQELLRAALVDKMWHDLAAHSSLWKTVRLKNSQVHDWEGCSAALSRHRTQHLDLRKMLVPQNTDSMWTEFCKAMAKVDSLERLDLCRCSASTVEQVCSSCTQLKVLNAQAIRCQLMNFEPFQNLSCLEELRLKSVSGIRLKNPLDPICQLTTLRHLALTTFKDLGKQNPSSLGSLVNLESLELGECSDLPANFPEGTLAKLSKLRRLRLEKVQGGECPTFSYLQVIRTLPELVQLELVNFDVKPGFDEELALCTQLTKLLIIPTYVTQSATSNRMVMNGIGHLQERLTHFVWGVTHELLRVTELFVVQCEGKSGRTGVKRTDKKENSIPVLKPVPGDPDSLADDRAAASSDNEEGGGSPDTSPRDEDLKSAIEGMKPPPGTPPQVEIVPLPKLQRILAAALPHTKIKILKIPYHATWRQYLTDKDVQERPTGGSFSALEYFLCGPLAQIEKTLKRFCLFSYRDGRQLKRF